MKRRKDRSNWGDKAFDAMRKRDEIAAAPRPSAEEIAHEFAFCPLERKGQHSVNCRILTAKIRAYTAAHVEEAATIVEREAQSCEEMAIKDKENNWQMVAIELRHAAREIRESLAREREAAKEKP